MQYLFEYGDMMTSPYEAFIMDSALQYFPVRPHWHYYTELIYMLEGTAMAECDKKSYIVEPDQLILFQSKTIHALYSTSSEPVRYIVLKFDANTLSVANSYTPKLSTVLSTARNDECADIHFSEDILKGLHVREILLDCVKEMKELDYGYDIRIHSHLCNLMVYLLRLWRKSGFQIDKPVVADSDELSLNNITEYIDQHSDEPLRIEDLAKQCGMSYSYFAKNFKLLYGKSCKEYIEFIKVCKADDMLLFTDSSLDYISQETGFTDCSHFIKIYKKMKGITPKQRRLTHLNTQKTTSAL